MLHIAGINYESTVDAEGVACTIFFSGCDHFCRGCHSKDTWDFDYGKVISNNLISIINSEIDKRPFLSALVLSGGDPMYSAVEVKNFISRIHIPNNNIWCYTGFTIEEIIKDYKMKDLLYLCDVLVDGRYIESQRDITLPYRGSKNQRVIDIKRSLRQGKVVLWCD